VLLQGEDITSRRLAGIYCTVLPARDGIMLGRERGEEIHSSQRGSGRCFYSIRERGWGKDVL
jgi:hypothetical protein